MKWPVKILGLLLIGAIVYGSFIFFRSPNNSNRELVVEKDDTSSFSIHEDNRPNHQEVVPTTSLSSDENQAQVEASEAEAEEQTEGEIAFIQAVEKCFPRMRELKPTGSKRDLNWVNDSLSNLLGDKIRSNMDWKNIHFKNEDGEERRLRLVEELTQDEKVYYQLQLFKLDEEGYPELMELESQNDAKNPSDATIKHYIGEGEVFYEENAFTDVFPNAAYSKKVIKNGKLSEIEVHAVGRVLKCENDVCDCI